MSYMRSMVAVAEVLRRHGRGGSYAVAKRLFLGAEVPTRVGWHALSLRRAWLEQSCTG
jgi:hypothetical protein